MQPKRKCCPRWLASNSNLGQSSFAQNVDSIGGYQTVLCPLFRTSRRSKLASPQNGDRLGTLRRSQSCFVTHETKWAFTVLADLRPILSTLASLVFHRHVTRIRCTSLHIALCLQLSSSLWREFSSVTSFRFDLRYIPECLLALAVPQ